MALLPKLDYEDFSGGVNLRDAPLGLADNDLIDAQNVEPSALFSPAVAGRGGQSEFKTGLHATLPIRSMFRFYKLDGTSMSLICYSTKVSKLADNGTETVLSSAFTSDQKFSFTSWTSKDAAYFTNGVEAIQKYDGTTLAAVSGSPPISDFIEEHQNRLYVGIATDDQIRFSDSNSDSSWPSANALNVADNRGSAVTGIKSLGTVLVVLTDAGLWRLQGDPITGGEFHKYTEIPCIAPWSVIVAEEAVIFLGPDGLYATDGFDTRKISGKIDPIFTGYFRTAVTGFYHKKKQLWLAFSTSGGSNDQLWMFTPPRPNSNTTDWSPWQFTNVSAESFMSWYGGADTGQFYFGMSTKGDIRRADTGTQDVATDIECFFQTKWDDAKDARINKTVRYIHPFFDGADSTSYICFYTFGELTTAGGLVISSPSSVTWGPGSVTWGAGSVTWVFAVTLNARHASTFNLKNGKYISFLFQNSTDSSAWKFYKFLAEISEKEVRHTDLFAL
jgi:hypothetical protein